MRTVRLLLIENNRAQYAFADALKKRYEVTRVSSGQQALAISDGQPPDVVVVNAISLRTSGDRICRSLRQRFPQAILIHLRPDPPQKNAPHDADAVLVPSFTSRKLTNSIERLRQSQVQEIPTEEVIVCGEFVMDVTRRVLVARGQETPLTPKLARLVEQFFRNPGQILDRKALMQAVWQTDYVKDTRTLDVHVRWIRQALEVDPGKPCYLKTVRGVGYRLDVDLTLSPELELMPLVSDALVAIP